VTKAGTVRSIFMGLLALYGLLKTVQPLPECLYDNKPVATDAREKKAAVVIIIILFMVVLAHLIVHFVGWLRGVRALST
jgi:hypothetical protein